MLKTMWLDFWNRLGIKEQQLCKKVGGFLVGLVLLIAVGNLLSAYREKSALEQIGQALKDVGAQTPNSNTSGSK